MTPTHTFSRLKAGFLLLVFLTAWMVRTGHALLIHHVHHEVLLCADGQGGKHNTTHLHDQRYKPDDCSVYAFLFSTPLLHLPEFSLHPAAPSNCCELPPTALYCRSRSHSTLYLRGPPAPAC